MSAMSTYGTEQADPYNPDLDYGVQGSWAVSLVLSLAFIALFALWFLLEQGGIF